MNAYIFSMMKRYNYLLGEIEASYHEVSLKLGLSDSAMKILYAICDNGESCLLQDICRRSGLSKQTINSAVRKLEAEGMIYLEMADSKHKKVCLTEEEIVWQKKLQGRYLRQKMKFLLPGRLRMYKKILN